MQQEYSSALSESPSTKAWTDLVKLCLMQTILFNRRREGELASMPLHAFFTMRAGAFVTRGKQGRPVPILLTPKMLSGLELLVKQRIACRALKDNIYMFTRPDVAQIACVLWQEHVKQSVQKR